MPTKSANPRIYTAWNGQGGVQVTNITTNISIKGNQNRCSNIELILNILNAFVSGKVLFKKPSI